MKDAYLKSVVSGFAFGIITRSLFVFSAAFVSLICLFGVIFIFYYFVFKKKIVYIFVSLFILSFVFGVFRFHISDKPFYVSALYPMDAKYLSLHGIINSDPEHKESSTEFILLVDRMEGVSIKHKEKVLVRDSIFSKVEYGDEIIISGILKRPESFTNQLGKTFDYVSYLKKDGIDFTLGVKTLNVVSSGNGNFLKESLFSFKKWIDKTINKNMAPPESSLLSGILLGTRSAMSKELKDAFIETGTIHIVALSGYNVTIVAEAVMKVFSNILPFFASIGAGILAIVLFAIMTGAGSTVVRASIMAILVLLARATGRAADIGRALALAGICMVLVNPWVLVYDVSFQLSFLATIGLVYLTPKVEERMKRLSNRLGLRTVVASTVATNIFVLPFIVYQMGIFSIVALPVNVLILPTIPFAMLFGVFTIAFGAISTTAALPVSFATHSILTYVLSIIKTFASFSFASISVSHVPFITVLISYTLLCYFMFRIKFI